MPRYYCPACFSVIAPADRVCPACGTHIDRWEHQHSYFERCIHALRHPNPEVRATAVLALGARGDNQAAAALARCALDDPLDITQGLEVVRALVRLAPGPSRQAALTEVATRHPVAAVREAATEALVALDVAGPPVEG